MTSFLEGARFWRHLPPPGGEKFRRHPPKNIKKMQILSKKAKNNNFWTIFSVFDKFQPSPPIFWGVTSVTSFVVEVPPPRQSSHVSAVYSSSKSNHPSEIYPPRLRAAILQSTISRCLLSMCQSSHIHAIYTPNQNKQSSAVYLPWVRAPMLPPFTWLWSEQPCSRSLPPRVRAAILPCS